MHACMHDGWDVCAHGIDGWMEYVLMVGGGDGMVVCFMQ